MDEDRVEVISLHCGGEVEVGDDGLVVEVPPFEPLTSWTKLAMGGPGIFSWLYGSPGS